MKLGILHSLTICLTTAALITPALAQHEEATTSLDLNLHQATHSTVEKHLRYVANQRKIIRHLDGSVFTIIGVSIVAVAANDNNWNEGAPTSTRLLVGSLGLFSASFGIGKFLKPSRAEQVYENLLLVDDVNQRERLGRDQLQSFAKEYKQKRFFTGFGLLALSAYRIIFEPYKSNDDSESSIRNSYDRKVGTMWGIVGLGFLLFKSPEEIAFQRYLDEREKNQPLDIRLIVNPLRRHQLTLNMSF